MLVLADFHLDIHSSSFFAGILLFLFLLGMYMLSAFIGILRHKRGMTAVFLVNWLLGWTVIGWIIALVLACLGDTYKPEPEY
jgi:hypothetical protein